MDYLLERKKCVLNKTEYMPLQQIYIPDNPKTIPLRHGYIPLHRQTVLHKTKYIPHKNESTIPNGIHILFKH